MEPLERTAVLKEFINEIRNALQAIVLNTHLLSNELETDRKTDRRLKVIDESVNKISAVIEDLARLFGISKAT